MKLTLIRSLPGIRALCFLGDRLVVSHRSRLGSIGLDGTGLRWFAELPESWKGRAIAATRLTRRVLRYGPHCAIALSEDAFLVSFGQKIYRVELSGRVEAEHDFSDGFRPLHFAAIAGVPGFEERICYGEYDGRISGGAIRIVARDRAGHWEPVYTFAPGELGHIHTLVPDPAAGCVWVLAGDYGDAAGIWRAKDDFRDVTPYVRGSQRYRTCAVFPTKDGLVYATDSHTERNFVQLLDPSAAAQHAAPRELHALIGSCVYACNVGDLLFFATAVEPGEPTGRFVRDVFALDKGPGILEWACEIVAGTPERGFARVHHSPVDRLPKRLFQFSSLRFPAGSPSAPVLVTYGTGLRGRDDVTEFFAIEA